MDLQVKEMKLIRFILDLFEKKDCGTVLACLECKEKTCYCQLEEVKEDEHLQ